MLNEGEKHLSRSCVRHIGEALTSLQMPGRRFLVEIGAAKGDRCGLCGIQATFKIEDAPAGTPIVTRVVEKKP